MDLGSTIRILREIRRLSQSDLAKKVEVERTYLSTIEQGKGTPSLKLLRDIASALSVPPALLLLGEGDKDDPILRELQPIWAMILANKMNEITHVPQGKHQDDGGIVAADRSPARPYRRLKSKEI